MNTPLKQTWDLESIFPGGSSSPEFLAFVDGAEADVAVFRQSLDGASAPTSSEDTEVLQKLTDLVQSIQVKLHESYAFVGCLSAQNQNDKKAIQLEGKVRTIAADYLSGMTFFDQLLKNTSDDVWNAIVEKEPFKSVAYPLSERRELAKEMLSPEMESLINELAIDGYHGWSDLYDTTVSQFRIPYEEDGKVEELSAGQAFNKLNVADYEARQAMMKKWEDKWSDNADFCAEALNHLAGFRLKVYKQRGWDTVHKEPLDINRLKKETLDIMWEVIDRNKDVFVKFLNRKAQLLGLEKLSWVDVGAPLGDASQKISYDDGAKLIVEQFRNFSPKMADFAVKAFESAWIEAEDRGGKRPGGFCTGFPVEQETRIFMTYSGTTDNVGTLAHELGHSYHQYVMEGMPPLAHNYAMNVAETASTFAEMIVNDALVKNAATDEEKIVLLEGKIGNSISFFMNIHARFIFETNFYAERSKGIVSVERLNELMVDAQKAAYKDALSEYHPHFWAAKLHFYSTGVPFYNFPYTFGYLFSAGIYARAVEEGIAFEDKYAALLRDTGSMTTEQLAEKHLGVDLTKPDFWQAAVDMAIADVEYFLELTADKVK
ncbi:M3 family oligoendopeptidase [Paenibacillus albiflavus]|uniref:M3 family oligoendopeptidase n=1 Tax=Paenibacillus albiflavus TaxID=2545760 RepID=A0A4R4ECH9_9BACL|nr:M3 family oligoendopeptidase [Paenibacillus albiflavus]TCZ75871.1 M3 family oligoendopeptidase [Paenibacillus albiflavus]